MITKEHDGEHAVECFVHVVDNCRQDWSSVASILENVFHNIKAEKPALTKVFLRSYNAGCYHCVPLLFSLPMIGRRTGRQGYLRQKNHNQTMKSHIRRYVNEKHNVSTAKDMKEALEAHGGVKGCRVAVAQMAPDGEHSGLKWEGVKALNNFQYEDDSIRVWRAYNIETGELVPFSTQVPFHRCRTFLRSSSHSRLILHNHA
ncbi:hypothetical protein Bbelb_241220 [Branchiostoma belcheri]|nr:hypothetical protein Bbelb_241220 [Branchiostoma belcheri]